MIDTIKGYIEITNKEYSDFEHLFPEQSLNKRKNNNDYSRTFNLSNFKFTIKFDSNDIPTKLWFNGSLSKFYFGNNLAHLDLESTKKAVEKLSDKLNLDFSEAIITRVDVGFSFILKKPIPKYISYLQDYPRLSVLLKFPNSITFGPSNRNSLTYYDKLNEMKNRQKDAFKELNKNFSNKHILRYETRLFTPFKKELGIKSIKAKNLYSKTIQKKLFSIWKTKYYETLKLSIDVDPRYLLKERNGTLLYSAFLGIKMLGYRKIKSEVYSTNFKVKNHSQKRSKMLSPIKDLLKEVNSKKLDNNLMKELDSKIELMGEIFN